MFTQLVRIGKDAELKYISNGKAVCGVNCAYDIGWGDKKRTQWIECVLWDKRAESLAQYMVKGQQMMVVLDDLEVETFQKNDGGQGSKLKGRVVDVKLCGPKTESQQQAPQQRQQQAPQQAPPQAQQQYQQPTQQAPQQQATQGFDDFKDTIPF